ncbi:MAG TPA: hypothetical protein VGC42_12855, partial [Kofleriaceae bacterium]
MRFASLVLIATCATASCGGGHGGGEGPPDGPDGSQWPIVPLAAATDLVVVAHAGDDLRYMQPDLGDAVVAGGGVTVVYVTDGFTEGSYTDPDTSHSGVKAAYAFLAGSPGATWSCGAVVLGTQHAEHCRLDAAKLSLVFLGYPIGGADGAAANSLLHLWEAKVTSVTNTAAVLQPTYSQVSLIATLAAAIDATMPGTVRTLEIAATHGAEHSDHMLVGALALLATAASSSSPQLAAYRGDNIAGEPVNADADTAGRTSEAYGYYAACATGCAACGTACTTDKLTATDA